MLHQITLTLGSYFDNVITMNQTYSSCSDNISNIILVLSKLGFDFHSEKSTLKPCQKIEYFTHMNRGTEYSVTF